MTFSTTGIAHSAFAFLALAAAVFATPAHGATEIPKEITTAGALASQHQRAVEQTRYLEYEAYLERRCEGVANAERITVMGRINLDGWSRTTSHIVAGEDNAAKLSVEYFIRDSIPFRDISIDSARYPAATHGKPEPRLATIDEFTSEAPLHPAYVFAAFLDSTLPLQQIPDTATMSCSHYESATDENLLTICMDSLTGLARDVRIEQPDNSAAGACRISAHATYTPVAGPPAVEPTPAIAVLFKKEIYTSGLNPDKKPDSPEQAVPGACFFPDKPSSVETFSPADGLPDAPVTAMIFDDTGVLWAGTRKGIVRRAQGVWTTFTAGGKLFGTPVTDFLLRPGGIIWAATPSGIYTYDGSRWDVISTGNGLPDNNVMSLAASADGRDVWAGTMRGLGRFRDGAWRKYTTSDGLPDNDVMDMAIDAGGTLWAGTIKGLVRFSNGRFLDSGKDSPVADQFIKVLAATPDGNIWAIAGALPGVAAGNAGHWTLHTGADGLPCAHVAHVAADRNGCVWAACLDIFDTSPALIYFDGVTWHTFTQGAGDHPYLLAPAPDGSLWAATARGIIHIIF